MWHNVPHAAVLLHIAKQPRKWNIDRTGKKPYPKMSLKTGFGHYPQSLQDETPGIFLEEH
jgi:hypothetical protein